MKVIPSDHLKGFKDAPSTLADDSYFANNLEIEWTNGLLQTAVTTLTLKRLKPGSKFIQEQFPL